jgi:hypothetical protein
MLSNRTVSYRVEPDTKPDMERARLPVSAWSLRSSTSNSPESETPFGEARSELDAIRASRTLSPRLGEEASWL